VPAAITVRDRGATRIRKQLAQLGRLRILVGVVGSRAREIHPGTDGETVGTVALWLNYGTERMPARPYLDRAIATMTGDLGREARESIRKIVGSQHVDVATALRPLAERMLDEVRHEFDTARQWAEPLAQSTIDRKGHDQPLLDGGTVRDALSYAIVDGDQVLATGGYSS
jgi:hypothetical protein